MDHTRALLGMQLSPAIPQPHLLSEYQRPDDDVIVGAAHGYERYADQTGERDDIKIFSHAYALRTMNKPIGEAISIAYFSFAQSDPK